KSGEADFLRAVAESVLQILMEADVEGLIGAGRHERTGDRLNYRNGYRDRTLDTRLGPLSLRIPKLDRPPLSGQLGMLVEGWPWHQREHGRRSGSGLRSRPCGESGHEHLRGRRPVADRGMRANHIVVTPPTLDDDLRFSQCVEDLAIEQFVAQ